MAPPLLPITRLVLCSACSEHVKSSDDACPHCGAVFGTRHGLLARAAGVALAGVMLTSCGGEKGGTDSATETETGTGTGTGTESGTETAGTGTTASGTTTADSDSLSDTAQPAYGVPTSDFTTGDTDTTNTTVDTSATDTGTGTGTTSMTGGPEYGVPETTGGPEPDYGVPGTSTGP
jgi:hypothetical protein